MTPVSLIPLLSLILSTLANDPSDYVNLDTIYPKIKSFSLDTEEKEMVLKEPDICINELNWLTSNFGKKLDVNVKVYRPEIRTDQEQGLLLTSYKHLTKCYKPWYIFSNSEFIISDELKPKYVMMSLDYKSPDVESYLQFTLTDETIEFVGRYKDYVKYKQGKLVTSLLLPKKNRIWCNTSLFVQYNNNPNSEFRSGWLQHKTGKILDNNLVNCESSKEVPNFMIPTFDQGYYCLESMMLCFSKVLTSIPTQNMEFESVTRDDGADKLYHLERSKSGIYKEVPSNLGFLDTIYQVLDDPSTLGVPFLHKMAIILLTSMISSFLIMSLLKCLCKLTCKLETKLEEEVVDNMIHLHPRPSHYDYKGV